MKLFLALAVMVSVLAVMSADMFGANNALNKKFPGSKPISVNDYNKLVQQQQATRPTTTPSPNPNWMFENSTSTSGGRRQNTRPTAPSRSSVRADSDEQVISKEDD